MEISARIFHLIYPSAPLQLSFFLAIIYFVDNLLNLYLLYFPIFISVGYSDYVPLAFLFIFCPQI